MACRCGRFADGVGERSAAGGGDRPTFLEDAGRDVELVTDRSLYDGTMQPEGSAVFREIGYAPLDFYLKDGRANAVLGDYAENAAARVAATLAGFGQCFRDRRWSSSATCAVILGRVDGVGPRRRRDVSSVLFTRRPSTSRPRPFAGRGA